MISARRVFAALAALLVSATLIESVAAYPVTARTGTTTVTGVFRPLDLQLAIVDPLVGDASNSRFYYEPNNISRQTFALTALLRGTFTSNYGAFGTAGDWMLNLGFNDFNRNNFITTGVPLLDSNVKDSNDGDHTIKLKVTGNDRPVGTLVYTGGLVVTNGVLPLDGSDTPNIGDMFLLYAKNSGTVFSVSVDDIVEPSQFLLILEQNLLHLGPFVKPVGAPLYTLNAPRVNLECDSRGRPGCGSVPSVGMRIVSTRGAALPEPASDVPEPASLALVGLGLAALAMVRRKQPGRLV